VAASLKKEEMQATTIIYSILPAFMQLGKGDHIVITRVYFSKRVARSLRLTSASVILGDDRKQLEI
jgi:hypothetical protein